MSDFVQTMKDWRRMCRTMGAEHTSDVCLHCPLLDILPEERGCYAIYADEFADNVDWSKLEQIVKKWAAEHPEPVYPTWGEWLSKTYGKPSSILLGEKIHADIAEKLGVNPKENE